MKTQKFDGSPEAQILTGMITNDVVCARMCSKWQHEMFNSQWANLVSGWVAKYHQKYGKAPRRAIENMYEVWARKHQDKSTVQTVDKFLTRLSEDYSRDDLNPDHVVDAAGAYFKEVIILRTIEQVQSFIDQGQVVEADEALNKYSPPKLDAQDWYDPGDDIEAKITFTSRAKPLFVYEEALKNFFGRSLRRDYLLAFEGAEKIGKSWFLMDLAWQAVTQRRRVGYFQIADLSRQQINERFYVRASQHPIYAPGDEWPCLTKIPTSVEPCPDRKADKCPPPGYDEVWFDKPLDWPTAAANFRKKTRRRDRPLIRIVQAPNKTMSCLDIKAILDRWIKEEFVCDVVVIDYADELAPMNPRDEERQQINMNWTTLKAISTGYHVLLATATQIKAEGVKKRKTGYLIDSSDFSGDKRKNAHVDGMVGINQTDEQKNQGVYRLNWPLRRDEAFSATRFVTVAGCLSLANPCMKSTF